jgi:NTP pyrophosphatase (non-canonical NTP hydrolase)
MIREQIFEEINQERSFQNEKHPHFPMDNGARLAILVEEVGEVAKDIQEKNRKNLRLELIQVAAVAVRWIEALNNDIYISASDMNTSKEK